MTLGLVTSVGCDHPAGAADPMNVESLAALTAGILRGGRRAAAPQQPKPSSNSKLRGPQYVVPPTILTGLFLIENCQQDCHFCKRSNCLGAQADATNAEATVPKRQKAKNARAENAPQVRKTGQGAGKITRNHAETVVAKMRGARATNPRPWAG